MEDLEKHLVRKVNSVDDHVSTTFSRMSVRVKEIVDQGFPDLPPLTLTSEEWAVVARAVGQALRDSSTQLTVRTHIAACEWQHLGSAQDFAEELEYRMARQLADELLGPQAPLCIRKAYHFNLLGLICFWSKPRLAEAMKSRFVGYTQKAEILN